MRKRLKLTVMGTSAGGMEAIQKFLAKLPESYPQPIVIVQHLPFDAEIDPSLVFHGRRLVGVAEDKMPLEKGKIYFAPPGYHALIEPDGTISLSVDPPVHFSRPSIDVLFESAARSFGSGVTGILMTGANHDGAAGLLEIQRCGGRTIVQDPETAYAPAMPREALRLFRPDRVAALDDMAEALMELGKEVVTDESESSYR